MIQGVSSQPRPLRNGYCQKEQVRQVVNTQTNITIAEKIHIEELYWKISFLYSCIEKEEMLT